MVAKWTPVESGFQFEAGSFGTGLIHIRDGIRLAIPGLADTPLDWLAIDGAEIVEESGELKLSSLSANRPYLQSNALIIPLDAPSQLGARFTARYLLDDQSLNLEVTAQVDRPIERIQLGITNQLDGIALELPFGQSAKSGNANRQQGRVVKLSGRGNTLAVFADMGEGGELRVESSGSTLRYTLFRQPLEKGVILVGRLALFPWDPAWCPEVLQNAYERWFESDSFL